MSIRVVLVNDTSDQGHPGCELVTGNFREHCARHGMEVVGTVLHDAPDHAAQLKAYEGQYDAILLNGEGTMHDDRPKAVMLMEAVKQAAPGTPRFLFNTVWQNNSTLNQYLPMFSRIYTRESLSAGELVASGAACRVVPDLVLATQVRSPQGKSGGIIVTDAVRTSMSRALFRYAMKHGLEFIPLQERIRKSILRKHPLAYLAAKLQGRLTVCEQGISLMEKFQRADLVISGRFHGICLALAMGRSAVAIASNTHKIEGMMKDIGLGEGAVLSSMADLSSPETMLAQGERDREKVQRYVEKAKTDIDAMFAEIKSVIEREKI